MGAAIIPLIAGVLSAGGALATNAANKKMAREQMAFQERMSNTAAQRSVEDYTKAGLNPGLAYERTASSPSGASATMEDALTKGISSAQGARMMMQQLRNQTIQAESAVALQAAQQETARTQAGLTRQQEISEVINRNFGISQQPSDARIKQAQALMFENQAAMEGYRIPGQRNTANYESKIGNLTGITGTARTLSEIIKSLGGVIRR